MAKKLSTKVFINKKPAIPAEFAKRPECACCGQARYVSCDFRMVMRENVDKDIRAKHEVEDNCPWYFEYTGKVSWSGRWYGGGKFCSLTCCERFAKAAYNIGVRATHQGVKLYK